MRRAVKINWSRPDHTKHHKTESQRVEYVSQDGTTQQWRSAFQACWVVVEFVSRRRILSSGDRLLRRLKWSREEQLFPIFALMYRNGNSSLLAKEQEWPSRLLHFPTCFILLRRATFPFFILCIRLSFSQTQKRHIPCSLH
jgi:hypothetical protein